MPLRLFTELVGDEEEWCSVPYFFLLFRMSFCTDFVILLTCEESLLS